jgi:hypothetical protein
MTSIASLHCIYARVYSVPTSLFYIYIPLCIRVIPKGLIVSAAAYGNRTNKLRLLERFNKRLIRGVSWVPTLITH